VIKIRNDVRKVYDALFDIMYREFNDSHENVIGQKGAGRGGLNLIPQPLADLMCRIMFGGPRPVQIKRVMPFG